MLSQEASSLASSKFDEMAQQQQNQLDSTKLPVSFNIDKFEADGSDSLVEMGAPGIPASIALRGPNAQKNQQESILEEEEDHQIEEYNDSFNVDIPEQ